MFRFVFCKQIKNKKKTVYRKQKNIYFKYKREICFKKKRTGNNVSETKTKSQ